MRRLVYTLSVSTVILAVSTAYLGRALYRERTRTATAEPPTGMIAPLVANGAGPDMNSTPPVPQENRRADAAESAARPATRVERRSRAETQAQELLDLYSDPTQRAARIDGEKATLRRTPGLGEHLHMEADDLERFIDLVVRQRIDAEESLIRCYLNKTCAPDIVDPVLLEAQRREMSERFGAQTPEAFEFFRDTIHMRGGIIKELRASLPDKHRLLDAQSETLIKALHEENQRIMKDAQARHLQVIVTNSIFYSSMAGTPREQESAQAALVYNRMILDLAASILSPEQMVVYKRMQQDELEDSSRNRTIR